MSRSRIAAAAAIALGISLGANAVLGPLATEVIRFRESSEMRVQQVGGEMTSLFVAAPLALVAGVLWFREQRVAPVLAAGPAGFALYMSVQNILVPDYARYDGNNERWFPLQLLLVMLSWFVLWRAWRDISTREARAPAPALARTTGTLLVIVNALVGLAWIASIASVMAGAVPREYVEHPTAFWLVRLMDLGFVVPIGVIVGVGLTGRKRWGVAGADVFLGTQALLACAVAGMTLLMWDAHDTGAHAALVLAASGGASLLLVLYALMVRRLL